MRCCSATAAPRWWRRWCSARSSRRSAHYGASHELEIERGRWVQRLMPSAERVRFTSSGTEAVQMAVRPLRAHTRRDLLIKFEKHFHGWSDSVSMVLAG
ncbi:MAG: hypothetical protein U0531_01090 [Dehalococcoidia bacterium]